MQLKYFSKFSSKFYGSFSLTLSISVASSTTVLIEQRLAVFQPAHMITKTTVEIGLISNIYKIVLKILLYQLFQQHSINRVFTCSLIKNKLLKMILMVGQYLTLCEKNLL